MSLRAEGGLHALPRCGRRQGGFFPLSAIAHEAEPRAAVWVVAVGVLLNPIEVGRGACGIGS